MVNAGKEEYVYESYTGEENGKLYSYFYSETTQSWDRIETSSSDSGMDASLVEPFKDLFASFTYDKDAKAYTAADLTVTIDEEEQTFDSVTLKFVDGKISYMKITAPMGEGEEPITMSVEMFFYAYGTTTVTLPTVTEPEQEPGIEPEQEPEQEPQA